MFFADSNFINLNRDHKYISFTYKRSFTETLDVNKLRLRCGKFQGEIAEITHPIFDQKIRCSFHSNINHNLQPHESNIRNINFCYCQLCDVCYISMQTLLLSQIEYF